MVRRDTDSESSKVTFTLCPNRSLSWQGMRTLMLGLVACLAAVSVYFISLGAWLVLPFAGIEAVVVALGIYLSARSTATRELVTLSDDEILIQQGRRSLTEVARFPRYWGQVSLLEDPRGWYPSRLLLGSHGRFVRVGTALLDGERMELARDLHQLIHQDLDFRNDPQPQYAPGMESAGQQI